MAEDHTEKEKLLFRMQHIIPQGLSTPQVVNKGPIADGGPEEIEFQMSYGKMAGSYILFIIHFIINE